MENPEESIQEQINQIKEIIEQIRVCREEDKRHYVCDCGKRVLKYSRPTHEKSGHHIRFINTGEKYHKKTFKEYYENPEFKEMHLKYIAEKIPCETCGGKKITRGGLKKHNMTRKHKNNLNKTVININE